MKWIPFSLRAQLAMVLVAAVVTVAVAVLLIVQLVGNTEGLLVAEARRQTALAAEQLQRQLLERLRLDSIRRSLFRQRAAICRCAPSVKPCSAVFQQWKVGIGWLRKGKFPAP